MREKIGASYFAERLRQLRTEAGIRQWDLAQRTGLSLSAVGHLEQGLRHPTLGVVLLILRALGLPSLAAFDPPADWSPPGSEDKAEAKPKKKTRKGSSA